MKVKTDVLLSVYSGWMMTNESFNEIKKVFEHLEGDILTDSSLNLMLKKWQPILEERFDLRKHFEKYIMPKDLNLVVRSTIDDLGKEVIL